MSFPGVDGSLGAGGRAWARFLFQSQASEHRASAASLMNCSNYIEL